MIKSACRTTVEKSRNNTKCTCGPYELAYSAFCKNCRRKDYANTFDLDEDEWEI